MLDPIKYQELISLYQISHQRKSISVLFFETEIGTVQMRMKELASSGLTRLSTVQGKREERSKQYVAIQRRVPERLTQKCAKRVSPDIIRDPS